MKNEPKVGAGSKGPGTAQADLRPAAMPNRDDDPIASIVAGAAKLLAESDASIFVWQRERIAIEQAEAERAEAEILETVLKGWKPAEGDIL